MTPKKKIALSLCILLIVAGALLSGLALYYYHSPSRLKALVEKSLSSSTNTVFVIDDLSYSLRPLTLQFKGIRVKPARSGQGFELELPDLTAQMSLVGPFGQKTLLFNVFTVNRFSARVDRDMALPEAPAKESEPSFLGGLLERLAGFLLFKEVRIERVEVDNGTVVLESADQCVHLNEIRARLTADHLIDMNCTARVERPVEGIRFEAPVVHIRTDGALSLDAPHIRGFLEVRNAVFDSPQVDVAAMELEAAFAYERRTNRVSFYPVDLRIEGARQKDRSEKKGPPVDLQFTAEGSFDLKENQVDLQRFNLDVQEALQLTGAMEGGFGPQDAIRLKTLQGHLASAPVFQMLSDWMGEDLFPFSASGPVEFSGHGARLPVQGKWRWKGDLKVDLKENRFAFMQKDRRLTGGLSGFLQAEGVFPELEVAVQLQVRDAVFSGDGVTTKPFETDLVLSGKHPLYSIDDFTIRVPQVDMGSTDNPAQIKDILVHLEKGEVNVEEGAAYFPRGELTSSTLRNLELSLKRDGEQTTISLEGKEIHLLESLAALNLLPSGMSFQGFESLDVKAALNQDACNVKCKLALKGIGFESQNSTYIGENISASMEMDADIDLKNSSVSATAGVRADKGELLWDKFYINLEKNSLSGSYKGRSNLQKGSLKISNAGVEVKDVIALRADGAVLNLKGDPRVDLSLKIEKRDVKPAFNLFVLEPFRAGQPFISSLEVNGLVSAGLRLKGSRAEWMVKGNCRWTEGLLSSKDQGWSLSGVALDLPVWFVSGGGATGQTIERGALSVQSVTLPVLPEQAIHVSLDALPNQLVASLKDNLKIPGGELRVGPLICKNLHSPQRSVETSLILKDVQVEPLLSQFWDRPMKGTINGGLDPVRLEGDRVQSKGEISVSVLNGEVTVLDLGASRVFSPGPVLEMSARWNSLSLAELTSGTAFGKVQGILEGHINGLEIAYGQPQAFDLLLETVKTRGISQKISVKAVDNISQLGGGQSPFMGVAGAFAAVFKEFPYKKIGINASLENDVFRVNGTIKEGGKEYLIKRGGISGVNVVNQNPDNRVGFKDMVKRFKRVTAEKSGPVVK